MNDSSNTESPENKADKSEQIDQLQLWSSWLEQAGVLSADIFQLLQLEVRLAISDSKRLLVLVVLFIPMLMLTWIGFSVFLAWQVHLLNMSVTQGLLAFFLIQLLGLVSIILGLNYYRKSLSLPLTRKNIRRLIRRENSDT